MINFSILGVVTTALSRRWIEALILFGLAFLLIAFVRVVVLPAIEPPRPLHPLMIIPVNP